MTDARETSSLERLIGRLLAACRAALQAGRATQARRDLDGAKTLRRMVDRLRAR